MSSQTNAKTSPKLAISYSFGEVASQMSWYMVNNYLMLFYTDVVSLSAGAISMIMLIARVWDAINDPMMGSIADRTHTKWGKFRPYLMFAPPFLAIFNILTFTAFPVQGTLKVILCFVCYVGTGMAYTACNIAYQALQNVCAIDSRVRMNLATAKGIGSSIIGIILSMVAAPALLHFSHEGATEADARGYFIFAIILSVAMIIAFWICAAGCKEEYTEQLHADENGEKIKFVDGLKQVAKNDQLMMVVAATILGTICVTGRMGMLTYYIIYVVGDFMHISTVFTVMTIFQLIGTLVLPIVLKKLSKKTYLIIMQSVMNIAFLAMYFLASKGIMVVIVLSAVCGFTNSAANICFGLVGDSLEYGAWKTGVRQEGIVASMLSFGAKISTALCGSVGVLLLAAVGYVAGAEQSEATKQGINLVVNILPMVVGWISIIPMFFYKLTPKKVEEIRTDLDAGKHAYDK